jgi:HK97 gp10 family phage protein
MLSARIKRKKKKYPQLFEQAKDLFLEEAGAFVEGEAKLRAPVDTNRLRDSINYQVTGDRAIVGTNVDYAPHVEYGTSPHAINSPVFIRNVGWRYIGEHPGTRAQPFLRPAIDENRRKLMDLFRDSIRRVFRGR